MKVPKVPPSRAELWAKVHDPERVFKVFVTSGELSSGHAERYLSWDELLRREPPGDLTHEEWWLAEKLHRERGRRLVPVRDKAGAPFSYCLVDPIPERLHVIDQGAGGRIEMPKEIANPDTKDRYYVSSLIEEAITSSQIEGATTTRRVAQEMLRTGREPRDHSERMIANNFRTMQRIGELKSEALTADLVLELHRIVTDETLDDPSAAGRLRRADEVVAVVGNHGEVYHEPPPAEELGERMDAMCRFANNETPDGFVHPALRSIILHFWLAYDHPFVDGNGRTARALFYWSMLHQGYWLFEFVSISSAILASSTQYGRAFLLTEVDDNDLTYFILYHLKVIQRAIDELHAYVERKASEVRSAESLLRTTVTLNHRQRALLSHALRHPRFRYTFDSHKNSHDVVYQTARTDLLQLAKLGLLTQQKIGRRMHFEAPADLEQRLPRIDGDETLRR
ncbi:MAG: Fic family protein [Deltaproteobacteria bacterium]|nr:Fic family protein [Deltaproteobacteria bacterium]